MTTSNEHNNAPAVPQGWKLVPVEPTPDMEGAGRVNMDYGSCTARQVWSAMLAATPAPAPAVQGEPVAYIETITGRLCAPLDEHRLKFPMCYEPLCKQGTAPAVPVGRTELEIVEQTEELAAFLMDWRWGQAPESPSVKFRDTENVKAQKCWTAACHIQEMITATDVENAVAEVDDDPEPDAAPAQEAMQSFTVPDDLPGMWGHSDLTGGETDCAKPAQEVGLTPDHHAKLWNEAENKAEYRAQAWLIYGQMVEKAIIAALRAKGQS